MLSKLIPKSLYARFLLIMLIPAILGQLIATYIFYERHWNSVRYHMGTALAGEIAIFVDLAENGILEKHQDIIKLANDNLHFRTMFFAGQKLDKSVTYFEDSDLKLLYTQLKALLPNKFYLEYTNSGSDIKVSIELKHGLMELISSNKRLSNPTTYIFIIWMTGTTLLLIAISVIFMRNQLKSILSLSNAAESFGKGGEVKFRPQGASEIRKAGFAFIVMKKRIEQQIRQRTEMLAGVSHDLRTPLTRMKLQLEMLEGSGIEQMKNDVSDMEKMIKDYLAFAKSESVEVSKLLDLDKLIRDLLKDFKQAGKEIDFKGKRNINVMGRETGLKRAITNIIENSLRYGNKILISLERTENEATVIIEDNGPGIPEDKINSVFKPFFRVDESRNQETGGAGLGLSIVKDIINKHGGKVRLKSSKKLGGLLVRISLPI